MLRPVTPRTSRFWCMVGVFLGAVLVAAACGAEDPDAPVLTVTVRATRLVLATPLATAGTVSAAPASAATATSAPASISSATPATAANLRGTATPRVEPPTTATQAATPEPPTPRTPAPTTTPPAARTLTQAPTGTQPPAGKAARVVQVIDGDTVDVVVDGVEHTVRLLGIDAPEADDTGGQAALAEQAREALVALVGDGAVILNTDGEPLDDTGRLLRHVMRADVVLSVELARQGWVRSREYAPNALFRDAIAEAQQEARAAARGRWAPPVAGLAMTVDKTAETRSRFEQRRRAARSIRVATRKFAGRASGRNPGWDRSRPGCDADGCVRQQPRRRRIRPTACMAQRISRLRRAAAP